MAFTPGLPVVSKTSTCPKCNQLGNSTRWCPGVDTAAFGRFVVPGCQLGGEHMHRPCQVCGFLRYEQPLGTPSE